LRVRYSECDAQGIVFNARWGEYVDVAATEYTRVLFGAPPDGVELDWRLVKQTTEWHAPARYDDVVDLRVRTVKLGTTSFVLATEAYRGDAHLVSCETIYVVIDPQAGTKRPIPDRHRALLERGAPSIVIDQTGAR
jgi:acyl-CoA thioester hydrolase